MSKIWLTQKEYDDLVSGKIVEVMVEAKSKPPIIAGLKYCTHITKKGEVEE